MDNKTIMYSSQPTLLIIILHDADNLPELLKAWRRVGVPGATILPSAGGHDTEKESRRGGLGYFLNLFDQGKSPQRTVLSIIDDPEILEVAIAEADRVVKGFDSPKSGILFTLPLGQVLGLQKWGQPRDGSEIKEEPDPEEKSVARLLKWFEEDVKGRYGEEALQDWTRQRNTPVSEILPLLDLHPTIVKMNTPLTEVMTELLANPGVPAACVVNTEGRLMGVIPIKALADVMMIPVMPESYINDPDEYEKALQYAQITDQHIAAGVMKDPVFVPQEETLANVFQKMRENNLSGIPVVDKNYQIAGFITLLGLMVVCFPDEK
jgi:CBS domain-containing protein